MPEPLWIWEDDLKRYRDTKTGRFVGVDDMQKLRQDYMTTQKQSLEDLLPKYRDGKIDIFRLEQEIKTVLKNSYIDMYAMGAGGRNNMTQADWGRIGAMLKEQYGADGYLKGLLNQIANGEISYAQINARLKMYVNSANEALWKGFSKDLPIELPAYPGDGSTVCLTNCQCEWEIIPVDGGYDCYWRLGEAEHCPDCVFNSLRWNPYTIRITNG